MDARARTLAYTYELAYRTISATEDGLWPVTFLPPPPFAVPTFADLHPLYPAQRDSIPCKLDPIY